MKILHTVEFYAPSKGGAQEVVQQLSERMAKAGHEVIVATTRLADRKSNNINGVKVVEFDIKGNSVVGISGETKKFQDFLVNSSFDVVMNYAAQQWATDLTFEILDKIKAKKIIVPCGYSALHNPDFRDYFSALPAILKKYSASVYASGNYQDIDFAKTQGIGNLHVIPNGASEEEFNKEYDTRNFRKQNKINNFFILNISNHTGAKGHAEMLEAFSKFPHPSTFLIVGQPSPGGCFEQCTETMYAINRKGFVKRKKVLLKSLGRDDTVAALKSADVFLFLSNIEASPLVLFESAAAGLPFISSDVGNAKEIAEWTGSGLISKVTPNLQHKGDVIPSVDSALQMLEKLYNNPELREQLGAQGRQNWQQKFTWGEIANQYLKLYEKVVR